MKLTVQNTLIVNQLIAKPHLFLILLAIFIVSSFACSRSNPVNNEVCEGYPPITESEYVLPFPVGKFYKLKQANCSVLTHTGNLKYAYDFFVEIGDDVTAARSGTVVFIKQDSLDTATKHEDANFMVIKQDDDTIGRYRHLKHKGVLVKVGDVVQRG